MNLVPYQQSFDAATLPQSRGNPLPGEIQGVYILLDVEDSQFLRNKIVGWFRDRDEVELVDHGTSDKRHLPYIMVEWTEVEVDPLFLAILRDEDWVDDYTVYRREIDL